MLMMPQMDGIEACQEIRELGKDNAIICHAIGRDENYTRQASFKAGYNDYITKPIGPKLLIKKLNGLLKIKHSKSNYKGLSNIGKYTIDHESHLISYDNKSYSSQKNS